MKDPNIEASGLENEPGLDLSENAPGRRATNEKPRHSPCARSRRGREPCTEFRRNARQRSEEYELDASLCYHALMLPCSNARTSVKHKPWGTQTYFNAKERRGEDGGASASLGKNETLKSKPQARKP